MYYRDQPKFRDEPAVDPESEQGKAQREAFFRLQETYFALPKEQRIPFLHKVFEREYAKVLTPEERAAVDLAVGSPSSSSPSSPTQFPSFPTPSCPSSAPCSTPPNPPSFFATNENTTPTQNVQKCAEIRPTADPSPMGGEWVSNPVVTVS